ncbi:MAG: 4-hydroxyphenylacetate 3-hydroxylase [Candidatus Competibacter sp.]|nr:4-hydroxyphenylacetate 3-hydroxylase [Candidatus Competibacter sp.]MDG4607450.1 4-hydroxyphenylacetate 3-hydroxylase N-terminal domain-containing protein [Candidatus Contendobacter sp.]HRD50493.1 4-hydroxyphenylacetate 3-hydroxylase N-terminal domain-containing protein [Candidatus Contendobacter sp.]
MLMSGQEYRESLRRYHPRVFINGRAVASVADELLLAPGVNGVALTYDFALREDHAPLMRTSRPDFAGGQPVNRMIAIPASTQDLLDKLEAVRLVCQETGCAQRYLGGDALSAIQQATARMDAELNTSYGERFRAWLERVYAEDLTLGVAMTDGKGDRSLRPSQQANPDAYVRIVERRKDGVVLRGVKAIITGAPYMHELLVMPGRNLTSADADYAVCCAVPVDAENLVLAARPAGRPGESAAKFSARYGQSTAVALFDRVFVPWDRVFLADEWRHSGDLTRHYATHHRHTCIGARAGFGDLLIGAGVLMTEANGLNLDHTAHLRAAMVDLIQIVEGFFACGVAASVYGVADPAGVMMPEPVFANIGKLLLATQIYDMHRLAHTVSGGLIVTLPGPEEDHNPATAGRLSDLLAGRSDIPYEKRIEVARFVEDLTASHQAGWYSVISLHGGGSPEAMQREIWRQYPVADQVALVERLLERGVLADNTRPMRRRRQPGRCCALGCEAPDAPLTPPASLR